MIKDYRITWEGCIFVLESYFQVGIIDGISDSKKKHTTHILISVNLDQQN